MRRSQAQGAWVLHTRLKVHQNNCSTTSLCRLMRRRRGLMQPVWSYRSWIVRWMDAIRSRPCFWIPEGFPWDAHEKMWCTVQTKMFCSLTCYLVHRRRSVMLTAGSLRKKLNLYLKNEDHKTWGRLPASVENKTWHLSVFEHLLIYSWYPLYSSYITYIQKVLPPSTNPSVCQISQRDY